MILDIKNLGKTYKNKVVLSNLDLQIEKPKLLYIQGKNGCGKTTLFKLICDLEKPTSGEIIKSEDLFIGAVIENGQFIENKSLEFNLTYLLKIKNNYDMNNVISLCERLALDFHNRDKLKNYSVGMRQKANLIQAIMEDQELILLDEPIRGMDDESIEIFCDIIKELQKEHKTIIITSHSPIPNLTFDDYYIMESGSLIHEKDM